MKITLSTIVIVLLAVLAITRLMPSVLFIPALILSACLAAHVGNKANRYFYHKSKDLVSKS